jgi:hypothetical protein
VLPEASRRQVREAPRDLELVGVSDINAALSALLR